jgi:hypothetical protein
VDYQKGCMTNPPFGTLIDYQLESILAVFFSGSNYAIQQPSYLDTALL